MIEDKSEIGRLLASLMHNPTQLHALRLLLGVQTHPALPAMQPYTPEQNVGPEASAAGAASCPPSYSIARDMLQGRGEYSPSFESDHKVRVLDGMPYVR